MYYYNNNTSVHTPLFYTSIIINIKKLSISQWTRTNESVTGIVTVPVLEAVTGSE